MAGIAHLGVGFAAKRAAPEVPLAILLISSMGLDLLSYALSFIGIERHGFVPFSHGLVMSVIISAAVFGLATLISKKIRIGIVLSFVVFSHWIIDFITWPMKIVYADAAGVQVLFDNSTRIGLGLHSNIISAILFEALFTGAGVAVYIFTLKKMREEKRLFENAENIQGGIY